jgi:hypothetical protein
MKIQIDPHTLQRARERGTSAKEVRDVITTGFTTPAKYGRRGKAKFMILSRSETANIMSRKEWKSFTSLKGM